MWFVQIHAPQELSRMYRLPVLVNAWEAFVKVDCSIYQPQKLYFDNITVLHAVTSVINKWVLISDILSLTSMSFRLTNNAAQCCKLHCVWMDRSVLDRLQKWGKMENVTDSFSCWIYTLSLGSQSQFIQHEILLLSASRSVNDFNNLQENTFLPKMFVNICWKGS